jgi:hypothetical protein
LIETSFQSRKERAALEGGEAEEHGRFVRPFGPPRAQVLRAREFDSALPHKRSRSPTGSAWLLGDRRGGTARSSSA